MQDGKARKQLPEHAGDIGLIELGLGQHGEQVQKGADGRPRERGGEADRNVFRRRGGRSGMDKGFHPGGGFGRRALRASGGAFPFFVYLDPAPGGARPRADSFQILRRIEILRNGAREGRARAFESAREFQRRIELEPGLHAFAGHRGKDGGKHFFAYPSGGEFGIGD